MNKIRSALSIAFACLICCISITCYCSGSKNGEKVLLDFNSEDLVSRDLREGEVENESLVRAAFGETGGIYPNINKSGVPYKNKILGVFDEPEAGNKKRVMKLCVNEAGMQIRYMFRKFNPIGKIADKPFVLKTKLKVEDACQRTPFILTGNSNFIFLNYYSDVNGGRVFMTKDGVNIYKDNMNGSWIDVELKYVPVFDGGTEPVSAKASLYINGEPLTNKEGTITSVDFDVTAVGGINKIITAPALRNGTESSLYMDDWSISVQDSQGEYTDNIFKFDCNDLLPDAETAAKETAQKNAAILKQVFDIAPNVLYDGSSDSAKIKCFAEEKSDGTSQKQMKLEMNGSTGDSDARNFYMDYDLSELDIADDILKKGLFFSAEIAVDEKTESSIRLVPMHDLTQGEEIELVKISGVNGKITSANTDLSEYDAGSTVNILVMCETIQNEDTETVAYSIYANNKLIAHKISIPDVDSQSFSKCKLRMKTVFPLGADGEEVSADAYWDDIVLYIASERRNNAPEITMILDSEAEIDDNTEVTVVATDKDGFIENVSLYVNDKQVGTQATNDSDRYIFHIDFENLGHNIVKAVAEDNDGASSQETCKISVGRSFSGDRNEMNFKDYGEGSMPFSASGAFNAAGNETTSYGTTYVSDDHTDCFTVTVSEQSRRGTSGPWIKMIDMATCETFDVEFDLYLTADGLSVYFNSRGTLKNSDASAMTMQIENGTLKTNSGKSAALSKQTWYRFKYVIDVPQNVYSLQVTDDNGCVLSESNAPLKMQIDKFSSIYVYFGGGANGSTCIDSLKWGETVKCPTVLSAVEIESGSDVLDYNEDKLTLNMTGIIKDLDVSQVKLFNDVGEVKLKSVTTDGNRIIITPDYMTNRGFEPSNNYKAVIDKSFTLSNGEKAGYDILYSFETSSKEVDVKGSLFVVNKKGEASYEATALNDTSGTVRFNVCLLVFEGDVFSHSVVEQYDIESGESAQIKVPIQNYGNGTCIKAIITDADFKPISNKVNILK